MRQALHAGAITALQCISQFSEDLPGVIPVQGDQLGDERGPGRLACGRQEHQPAEVDMSRPSLPRGVVAGIGDGNPMGEDLPQRALLHRLAEVIVHT